jgi:hypothetical protein
LLKDSAQHRTLERLNSTVSSMLIGGAQGGRQRNPEALRLYERMIDVGVKVKVPNASRRMGEVSS